MKEHAVCTNSITLKTRCGDSSTKGGLWSLIEKGVSIPGSNTMLEFSSPLRSDNQPMTAQSFRVNGSIQLSMLMVPLEYSLLQNVVCGMLKPAWLTLPATINRLAAGTCTDEGIRRWKERERWANFTRWYRELDDVPLLSSSPPQESRAKSQKSRVKSQDSRGGV